jgi:transcription initiation factor IIF auxiliary subunit
MYQLESMSFFKKLFGKKTNMVEQAYQNIEKRIKAEVLEPKREKLIQKIVQLLTEEAQKLVKDGVEIKVLNFVKDTSFEFDYYVMPDDNIIQSNYISSKMLYLTMRMKILIAFKKLYVNI